MANGVKVRNRVANGHADIAPAAPGPDPGAAACFILRESESDSGSET